jgi:NADH-quinone oxidoreductase subunit H
MGFGMFFQGEYIAMLSMGALIATLFLGGWHYPGYGSILEAAAAAPVDSKMQVFWNVLAVAIGLASFGLKVVLFIFFSMWVRWTLPRFRWDQLMNIGWKGIVPLALANLLLTALLNLPTPPKKNDIKSNMVIETASR